MQAIYKLTFSSGDFYIGQTINFKKRLAVHISSKGRGSPKLEAAWNNFSYLGSEILEEVSCSSELDAREKYWIDKLKPTLNTLPGGETNKGLNAPRAKYTREQVLEVVDLYINSTLSYKEISDRTQVNYSMVHDILKQRAHLWIWEEFPELKAKVTPDQVEFTIYDKDNNSYTATSYKELADASGIAYAKIRNAFTNPTKFASEVSTKPHPTITLHHTEHGTLSDTIINVKEILEQRGLSRYQVRQIINKKKSSAGYKFLVYQENITS